VFRRAISRAFHLLWAVFSRTRVRIVFLLGCGLILVATAWRNQLGTPRSNKAESDSVEHHYNRFVFLQKNIVFSPPKGFKATFTTRTLNWYLEGCPSTSDQFQELERRKEALLRLGYFEKRDFSWPGGGPLELRKFHSELIQRAVAAKIEPAWSMEFPDASSNLVTITSRKVDFPMIESFIREIKARAATNQ
jgi:hypothetical protein